MLFGSENAAGHGSRQRFTGVRGAPVDAESYGSGKRRVRQFRYAELDAESAPQEWANAPVAGEPILPGH